MAKYPEESLRDPLWWYLCQGPLVLTSFSVQFGHNCLSTQPLISQTITYLLFSTPMCRPLYEASNSGQNTPPLIFSRWPLLCKVPFWLHWSLGQQLLSCFPSALLLSWYGLVSWPCLSWTLPSACFLPYSYNKNLPHTLGLILTSSSSSFYFFFFIHSNVRI